MAVVRLGTCSWADEGLLKNWYPREVRTAEGRLRHYAEWFDTVEVDSTFYAIPAVILFGGAIALEMELREHRRVVPEDTIDTSLLAFALVKWLYEELD